MATSTITKKKKQNDFNKVKNFVKARLDQIPLIVDNGDVVRVGNYKCHQDDGVWQVYRKNKSLAYFTLKSSAVAWCIATINQRDCDVNTIVEQDGMYSRAAENAYIYNIRQRTTKDEFKKELMWIRHQDSVYQMVSVRTRLTSFLRNLQLS